MSLRAYRKKLKEREAAAEPKEPEESEDEDEHVATRGPANLFALLGGEADGDDGDNHENESGDEEASPQSPASPVKGNSAKPAKAKKKQKGKKQWAAEMPSPRAVRKESGGKADGQSEDDFDEQLREVSEMFADEDARQEADMEGQNVQRSQSILSVQRNYLSAENEMRRVFGSRTVDNAGAQRNNRRAPPRHLRSFWLAQPKPNWPPWVQSGLRMDLLEKRHGDQYFTFVHNKKYHEIEERFFACVESMNPDAIMALLQRYPYHVNSLLQLSEICQLQGDQPMSVELLERALYVMESNFHVQFKPALGTCKLPYRRYENRALFLALFRYIVALGQRGCWRTALEYNKFLLSLDSTDPVCSLLMVDMYALRAREYSWLIQLYDEWEPQRHLSLLPNFAYSVAMATMFTEQQERAAASDEGHIDVIDAASSRSNQMLQNALFKFPMVVSLLAEKASLDLPGNILTNPLFVRPLSADAKSEGELALQSLAIVYAERCGAVWKDPQVQPWLRANLSAVVAKITDDPEVAERARAQREAAYSGPGSRSVYRHVIMAGYRDAISSLPRSVREETLRTYDPLPPADSISPYDSPTRPTDASAQAALSMFLRSLLPSFTVEEGRDLVEQGQAGMIDLGNVLGALDMRSLRTILDSIQIVGAGNDGAEDGAEFDFIEDQ